LCDIHRNGAIAEMEYRYRFQCVILIEIFSLSRKIEAVLKKEPNGRISNEEFADSLESI